MEWRELIVDAYERLPELAEEALAGIRQADLDWQPWPGLNPLGWTVWHLTRVQDGQIADLMQAPEEDLWTRDGWHAKFNRPPDHDDSGYGHTAAQVKAFRSPSAKVQLDYLRAVTARTKQYLASVTTTELDRPLYVTTVASCFRNEQRYDDLRRLWGFTMREIVCIGTRDEVQAHLTAFKRRVLGFGERLGLGLAVEVGSDPFYQPQSARALLQQVFPQKEEFLYGGAVAIASVNFHRNFFGERCRIKTHDGQLAFTGCVAFGLERWLHALLNRFDQDAGAAAAAVAAGPPEGSVDLSEP